MSKSLKRVKTAALDLGLTIEVLEMSQSTRTAAEAADALGCRVDQIAKSIIFRGLTSERAILFLTSGARQVDSARASDAAQEPLGKADAALIRAQTGFAIGGVAPIGHLSPISCFIEPHLASFDEIWAAAGTPRHLFRTTPADLIRVCNAQVFDFTARD